MTMRSNRAKRNAVCGRGAVVVLAGAGIVAIAASMLVAALVFADEPEKPATAETPRPRLTLSREVTFFTEPIAADGLIDYAAALNARFGKDVTPENNAAVALLGVLGPDADLDGNEFAELCASVGIAPLPKDGDYFVPFNRFVDKLTEEFYNDRTATAKRVGLAEEALRAQLEERTDWTEALERCERTAWTGADEPLIALWLTQSQRLLAAFRESSRKSRYHVPQKQLFVGVTGSWSVTVGTLDLVRAARANAMRLLAAGKSDEAWAEAIAVRRWGVLACEPRLLIDQLIGITLLRQANATAWTILAEARDLDSAKITRMEAEWNSISGGPSMEETFMSGERGFGLEAMNMVVRSGADPRLLQSIAGESMELWDSKYERTWRRLVAGLFIDWEAAFRVLNQHYDELADIARTPPGSKLRAAIAAYEEKVGRKKANLLPAQHLQFFTIATLDHEARRAAFGRMLGMLFTSAVLPGVGDLIEIEATLTVESRLGKAVFALARHRADRGNYPERLDQLVPAYLETVPADDFGDGPLKYKRRDEGGFELYSVGVNGRDDGGMTDQPLVDTTRGADGDESNVGEPDDDAAPQNDDAEKPDDLVVRVGPPRK